MADEVTIVNQGFAFLGVDPITSLDDGIKSSDSAKNIYDDARDACLEEADWSFAKKSYVLTASTDKPTFGSGVLYPIPTEIIRIISVDNNVSDWEIEEGNLLLSSGAPNVKAIYRLLDVNKMSPSFRMAFSARIAWELALPLTKSKSMYDKMERLYGIKTGVAKARDGLQGTTRKFTRGRLVGARQNGQDLGGRSNVFGPEV